MNLITFRVFMKIYNLKNDTRNESQIQNFYIYPIYPRNSKIYSNQGFVKIGNGSQAGTHWTCFIVKITNNCTFLASEVNQINFY